MATLEMADPPSEIAPISPRDVIKGLTEFDTIIRAKLDTATEENPIRAAIFGHAFPDPDCISSQMGISWLLHRLYGIESDSFYAGEISHPQNNAMTNLLEPNLIEIPDDFDPSLYKINILVDTVPHNAGSGGYKIPWDVVIDHHKDQNINGCKAHFIHAKTGSCASMVFHLMKKLCPPDIWLDADIDYDNRVATALIAGILTDTEHMTSEDSTDLEFEAYQTLFPFRSPKYLKEIVFFKKPKSWMESIAIASREAVIDNEGNAIVGLGLISDKQRDIVSAVADEMVTWASVESAIAFAVVGNDKVIGSVRSSKASFSVSEFCKKLGKHGQGGGKQGKGAYTYPLGALAFDPDDEDLVNEQAWKAIQSKESARICRMLKS